MYMLEDIFVSFTHDDAYIGVHVARTSYTSTDDRKGPSHKERQQERPPAYKKDSINSNCHSSNNENSKTGNSNSTSNSKKNSIST